MDFSSAKVSFPEGDRYFDVHYRPILDSQGTVLGMLTLGTDITEQKTASDRLQDYQMQLRSLTSEMALAEERERKRIATELHDRTIQTLAVAKIKMGLFGKEKFSKEQVAECEEISSLIENTIQETRSLVYELSPPVLYELGFEPAVQWLAEHLLEQQNIKLKFEDDQQHKSLDKDFRVVLFQAVRELLMNIVKHSQAKRVKISIKRKGKLIKILVQDDGVGINANILNSEMAHGGGFGLFNIRERLNLMGGQIDIASSSKMGTKIILTAPLL